MHTRAAAALLAASLLGAADASAQTGFLFNRLGSGARAAGMANAFVAISDDGTAASWNPAGLGQLRKPELSLVGTTRGQSLLSTGFRTRDDSASYGSGRSSYHSVSLDFASLAAPFTAFGRPVTLQAAWRRLYTIEYRETVEFDRTALVADGPPPLRIRFDSDTTGSVDLLSLAGALKLTPRLAAGASVNLWRGGWTDHRFTSQSTPGAASAPLLGRRRQQNDVEGENLSLGLMLTYPRWSVGLVHQSPLRADFGVDVSGERSDRQAPEALSLDGSIRFARSIGFGGAWRPAPRWAVALDLTWDDWTGTLVQYPPAGPVNLFDELPQGDTSTRDAIVANVGAEHLFQGEGFVVPLRFGAAWEPQGGRSPYTRDPIDYVMVAAGTGYNTNSLKFDAALQYRWTSFRDGATFELDEAGSVYLPHAVGERRVREWRLKFSLIVRITDTEKLRGTLRRVFGGD
jgi:long-subunit fatty acid transport protein